MPKTLIRHASGSDFHVLLEIDEACFPLGIAYDSSELTYYMNRTGAETIVLEHDGAVVAFLIMEVDRRRRKATLSTIDVGVDYRRHGYGTQLLVRSEELLAGHGIATYHLQVDVGNSGAIAFYRRHGFEATGLLKEYYANGHDAYHMEKRL